MFFHPANFLFIVFLMFSIFFIISSNSWLMIWICLEINVLMFIPLIFKKYSKYQSEVAMKYFIIQAMASIIILSSVTQMFISSFNSLLLFLALMLKIGAAPLHMWVPNLVEGLSWDNFFLLMTTQKISPIIVLSFNLSEMMIFYFMVFFITTSALMGSISGILQSSTRKVLTFSSISHLSWIFIALMWSKSLWLFYFFIYSFVMYSIIVYFFKNNFNKLSNIFKKKSNSLTQLSISMLSLGGLPPFSGFLPKFLVMTKVGGSQLAFLLVPAIMGSLISLFFYLRVVFYSFFTMKTLPNLPNSSITWHKSPVYILNMLGIMITIFFIFLLLDFKLKKL